MLKMRGFAAFLSCNWRVQVYFTFCKYFCNQRWIDADIENCVRIFSVCTLDDDGYKLSWISMIFSYSESDGYQLRTFSDTRTDISRHVSTKPIRSSFLNEATILWGKKFLLTFPYITVDHTHRLHLGLRTSENLKYILL